MLANLHSYLLHGIDAIPVRVELDVASSSGGRKTVITGLPRAAVREATQRIERACLNSGFALAKARILVHLSPADLEKTESHFDLPIALGMLVATRQLSAEQLHDVAIVGELSLDGDVRPARGVLSMAMAAREQGLRALIVPTANAREAAVVDGIEIVGVDSLEHAVEHLSGKHPIERTRHGTAAAVASNYDVDFADVKGQESTKRALTVAAAGGHNVLMSGAPGCGKTMLARRLPTILPPLTQNESLETTRIYSAVGQMPSGVSLLSIRPFRSPHHTISDAGMCGGGQFPGPGEISLAHRGVLFLDELAEFSRRSLEVLRQPLEEGCVTIARAGHSLKLPADIILVASMNPCPCGFQGDPKHKCHCSPQHIEYYVGRLSGPLLDRVDLQIEVPSVAFSDLSSIAPGTSSADMRRTVDEARAVQAQRFGAPMVNARMNSQQIREHCRLDEASHEMLRSAMEDLGLSARAHDRILRMARTIADVEGAATINESHLAESISYRSLDRRLWAR
jgi:magnesium chelatase family protein